MPKDLTELDRTKADAIIREVAEEHEVDVQELLDKAPTGKLRPIRRRLYNRLRFELALSNSHIGKVCNRSTDCIGEIFRTQEKSKNADKKHAVRRLMTWLSEEDYTRLELLANKHNVTVSDMARAGIVDMLCEEYRS